MAAISLGLAFAALWRSSAALMVADGSPCASKCGNVLDSTTPDMVVCSQADYSDTSSGQVFESCVSCEATSPYSTTKGSQNVSDLQYMLYNLRYATNQCLFAAASNPCTTSFACEHIQSAIQYANLSSSVSEYGYCSEWTDYLEDKCHDCLNASPDSHYLSNYVSILSGACRLQLPPPATLPLQGGIFDTSDTVNVTDPTPTATFTPPATGALDSGAIAGIVVGGVVVLLTLIGCGVVINGKRRRKAYLRRREEVSKNWPSPSGPHGGAGGEMFETPISQRPLRGWEDSPISAATQTTFPPYFSPYSSQYNSPVSGGGGGVEGAGVGVGGHMAWPAEKTQNIGVALSPDRELGNPQWAGDRKGKDRVDADGDGDGDGYELQEGVNSAGGYGFPMPPPPPAQAPMLSHPGYGRHGFAPQQYGEVDEDGVRR
ncbi:hypothetical protein F5B20DRAFT_374728 [Whalleya microplaca]|nr:hypothetical protein F5B20DRAFT_374728 [Whalleya microplaca]